MSVPEYEVIVWARKVAEYEQAIRIMRLALEQIERWDGFPSATTKYAGGVIPCSYSHAFGSNGERDYMRGVADRALHGLSPVKGGAL